MIGQPGDSAATERFWKTVEERHGAPVLVRGMASYISGPHITGELWGLMYLVPDRLVFQHFAQRNWFSTLVTSPPGSVDDESRPARERNIEIHFVLAELRAVRIAAPPQGIRRLISGGSARLSIEPRDGSGAVELRIEHGADEFAQHLPRAFRAAAP